jgi:hypothetical protein
LNAGFNLTTGSNNIDIGSAGVTAESKTIRVGTPGTHTATFIAGISSSAVTGNPVVVSSTGKLGIVMSSARFKRDIRDMGKASADLLKLRPVTFRYKNDPEAIRQYGLVAEEVARIYPELVTYGADGKVQTVNYLTLTSMLLNELQHQARKDERLAAQMVALRVSTQRQIAEIKASFEQRFTTMEQAMRVHNTNRTLAAELNRQRLPE